MKTETRKVAYSVVLAAIAIALSPLATPIAGAKIYPVQSLVNVVAAVFVGPWYAVAVALVAAIARNAMGTGSLFAFPGGMIGALLAGLIFRYTRNVNLATLGEMIGTGIFAALFSTLIWVPSVAFAFTTIGQTSPLKIQETFALVIPFLLAAIPGSIAGIVSIRILERAGYVAPRSETSRVA